MTEVHFLFRVDPPIAVDKAVAGRRYQIRLRTGPTRLTLPTEHTENPTVASTWQKEWPTFAGSDQPMPLRRLGTAGWVTTSIRVNPSEQQLNIEAMLCRAEVDDDTIQGYPGSGSISSGVSEWLSTVRSWLGAWTHAPQHPLAKRTSPEWVGVYKTEGHWTRSSSGGVTPTIVTGVPLVSPEQLDAAFRAASAAAYLEDDDEARHVLLVPLEHQILARAQLNSLLDDDRAAVIDTCCAAEVAMGKAVNRALEARGVDEDARDLMVSRTSGVVEMFRLYLVATRSILGEKQVMDQLARPRNRAAHGGERPTTDIVKRSFKTARTLVEEASPLPSPAALRRLSQQLIKAKV